MKFSEAIEEIKDTGGIVGIVGTTACFAIPSVKDPMIMLDDDLIPMKNRDYKPHDLRSRWMLWNPSPWLVLNRNWEVKEVFSPERKEYFSHIYG